MAGVFALQMAAAASYIYAKQDRVVFERIFE